jgi:hypothetical protein
MAPKTSSPSRPATAGYSGTPLPQKLGIKEGHRVAILSAPARLPAGLEALPDGVTVVRRLQGAAFDVILVFVQSLADLPGRFVAAARALTPAGGLWVVWPKKASGVATDVTEDRVREVALDVGLVDNKVCAVDEVWSGLRCVDRLKDRPAGAGKKK